MANSSLVTYTNITSNHSGLRTKKITKITPHYMAAAWTGKQCADYFVSCAASGRQASSNYCIGINGDIALSVPEAYRAWTSSSNDNDQAAVTIECGNNSDSSLPDACYKSLIKLCADICKRNGITPHYDGTANGTITMHKMFASTACPGSWLSNKIASLQFEKDILEEMSGTRTSTTTASTSTSKLYRVRKSWSDASSQIGAYASLENAKKACKTGYTVYDWNGNAVYSPTSTTSSGKWDYNAVLKKGDKIKSKTFTLDRDCQIVDGAWCAYIPELGGWVACEYLTENGAGDGKCDQVLHKGSNCYLTETTVSSIINDTYIYLYGDLKVKAAPLAAWR